MAINIKRFANSLTSIRITLMVISRMIPRMPTQSLSPESTSSGWMSNQLQGFPSAPPFPPATYPGVWTMDTHTHGAWRGRYGASGYQVRTPLITVCGVIVSLLSVYLNLANTACLDLAQPS